MEKRGKLADVSTMEKSVQERKFTVLDQLTGCLYQGFTLRHRKLSTTALLLLLGNRISSGTQEYEPYFFYPSIKKTNKKIHNKTTQQDHHLVSYVHQHTIHPSKSRQEKTDDSHRAAPSSLSKYQKCSIC